MRNKIFRKTSNTYGVKKGLIRIRKEGANEKSIKIRNLEDIKNYIILKYSHILLNIQLSNNILKTINIDECISDDIYKFLTVVTYIFL